jgi:hypothetical protein
MKTILACATAFAMAVTGAAFADDEETIEQELSLSGFDSLTISGVYELDVRVGEDYSIRLSGPRYEMDRAEVSVKNGALVLGQRDWRKGEKKRNNREGIDAVITLPSLTGLKVSGVVEGKIAGVDAEHFEVRISGVGDVAIAGECGELEAHLSGVGDLDAKDLECGAADVRVSGVGSAVVFASEAVDAKVSGMGDIDVYGSPKSVSKSKGMFSDVTVH